MRIQLMALLIAIGPYTMDASAGQQRPFRGTIGVSVLLCNFNDSPAPTKSREYYEELLIKANTGAHADYWRDVSDGSIVLDGVVKGWYTLDLSEADARAYGGGDSPIRTKKHSDCVDKAKASGYTPPADHLVVVITSPGIDTFGFGGGAFLGENVDVGVLAHEVGHGLSLSHSYSDDPSNCSADWASVGEYDDQWDKMSYANVFTTNLGQYGRGGPWLNAYHLDRMGWLDCGKIFRFGADGRYDTQVTLTALSRPSSNGKMIVRIPFDAGDLNHYYTVEYRLVDDWDSGIGVDRVLIHEVKAIPKTKCSDGTQHGGGGYNSYLVREHTGARHPKDSIDQNGVRIDLVSKSAATGQAVVRIRSTRPDYCVQG